METIIEKILISKKSPTEQKAYLTFIISKASNETEKIKFLMIIIEKTLHTISNLTVFFIFR